MLATATHEGAPIMTGTSMPGSELQINGSNWSSCQLVEARGCLWAINNAVPAWLPSPSPSDQIHDFAGIRISNSWISGNYVFYNALGYKELRPSVILEDLVRFQAHCNHGVIRKFPTHDQLTTNWSTTDIGGLFWRAVSEGTDNRNSDYDYTTTVNAELWLGFFGTLPTNVNKIKKIVVNLWVVFVDTLAGTGFAFRVKPYHSAVIGSYGSGTLIGPTTGKYAQAKQATTASIYQFVQLEFDKLDLTRAQCNNFEVMFKAFRGYGGGGGGTNPTWYLYTADVDFYVDTTDVDLVDTTSFDNVTSYFGAWYSPSYLLSGDFTDGTLGEACLKTIAHAPECVIYLANDGKLSLSRFARLEGAVSPDITITSKSPSFRGVTSYGVDDRRMKTEAKIDWSSRAPTSGFASPGIIDMTNDLGFEKYIDEADKWKNIPKDRPADITRELIKTAAVLEYWRENDKKLFGVPIERLELSLGPEAIGCDNYCRMQVEIPDLDIDKMFWLVSKEIDLDELTVDATLFYIDFDVSA